MRNHPLEVRALGFLRCVRILLLGPRALSRLLITTTRDATYGREVCLEILGRGEGSEELRLLVDGGTGELDLPNDASETLSRDGCAMQGRRYITQRRYKLGYKAKDASVAEDE